MRKSASHEHVKARDRQSFRALSLLARPGLAVAPPRPRAGIEKHARDDEIDLCSRSSRSVDTGKRLVEKCESRLAEVTEAPVDRDVPIRVSGSRHCAHLLDHGGQRVETHIEVLALGAEDVLRSLSDGLGRAKKLDGRGRHYPKERPLGFPSSASSGSSPSV